MPNSEVLKFRLNVEEQLHLAFPTGKPCSGITGPQFLYSLRDKRIAFADPGLDAQIQELNPKSGSRISVTKRPDNRWDVKLLHPPAEQLKPKQATSPEIHHAQAAQRAGNSHHPLNDSTDHSANGRHAEIPTQVQYGIAFADFLILAADAVRMAEKNSPAGSVRFDNRDVAAIATTMWIAADKSGFLTWNGAAQGGR